MRHPEIRSRSDRRSRTRTVRSLVGGGTVVLLAAVVVVAVVVAAGSGNPSSPPVAGPSVTGGSSQPAFGVLGSRCDPSRAAAERQAGILYAELGIDWSSFEPQQGQFDQGYENHIARAVRQCDDAGIRVVLTPGFHSAPSWVADLPEGSYRDQNGHPGSGYVPDVVFSAAVRDAVTQYLTELDRVIGLGSVSAIRVGTGINGELGYPQSDTDTSNPFWAFDAAAQQGTGLADGGSVTPMPGWKPGDPTWQGRPVTTAQVQQWFQWYSNSDADAVVWIVRELRSIGFHGDIHLPLAGRGALPDDLRRALAAHLDGTADRDGSLGGGMYYPDQLQRIGQSLAQTEQSGWGRIWADTASVDDSTAVSARGMNPRQDVCRTSDADTLLTDPQVDTWPSFRFTVAAARHAGLGVIGENPGPPSAPGTGGNSQTDGIDQQLVHAPAYAQQCGLALLMWAFEDDLFSDHHSGLDAYAARIRAIEADRRPGTRTGRKGNSR